MTLHMHQHHTGLIISKALENHNELQGITCNVSGQRAYVSQVSKARRSSLQAAETYEISGCKWYALEEILDLV